MWFIATHYVHPIFATTAGKIFTESCTSGSNIWSNRTANESINQSFKLDLSFGFALTKIEEIVRIAKYI